MWILWPKKPEKYTKPADALQNTRRYPIVCSSINITFDTELWSELCAPPG